LVERCDQAARHQGGGEEGEADRVGSSTKRQRCSVMRSEGSGTSYVGISLFSLFSSYEVEASFFWFSVKAGICPSNGNDVAADR
jgi:hypothetical protein